MTEIFAKIKNEYKNILSQSENVVDDFDVNVNNINEIEFSLCYKPDDDEWFKIKMFSKKKYFIEQCTDNFSSASINQIDNDDYTDISCIIISQDSNSTKKKYFQRITPRCFVDQTVLFLVGDPKVVKNKKQIEINRKSDAVYLADTDTLYFKKIATIKEIFPGIEEIEREATQDEQNAFLENACISISALKKTSIGVQNRHRIANMEKEYNALSDEKKEKLITEAKKKTGVNFKDGCFVIKSETDLKKVLYALHQRYYDADCYEEKRLANSIMVIK
ncbi:hypothetical protein BMR07_17360 [Methylococcaceae bacterium CS1]|nr:hypothetical protein BMR07_17360 [Methylococcaceae bacterium CS1]TXL03592.1 hypothetical protein BMR08_17080 [Methylococcaceae bacterium CS2]